MTANRAVTLALLLLSLCAAGGGGAVAEQLTTLAPPAPTPAAAAKVLAIFDARPSWTTVDGKWHTEENVELGYKFNADTAVTYMQDFMTNLYNPKARGDAAGLNAQLWRGAVRTRFQNILKDSSGLSLSYENRTYLPTMGADRDAGMMAISRN